MVIRHIGYPRTSRSTCSYGSYQLLSDRSGNLFFIRHAKRTRQVLRQSARRSFDYPSGPIKIDEVYVSVRLKGHERDQESHSRGMFARCRGLYHGGAAGISAGRSLLGRSVRHIGDEYINREVHISPARANNASATHGSHLTKDN